MGGRDLRFECWSAVCGRGARDGRVSAPRSGGARGRRRRARQCQGRCSRRSADVWRRAGDLDGGRAASCSRGLRVVSIGRFSRSPSV
ncbi:hypothetical protein EVAR_41_1 [Eumeta japonica]|uniref:Uncharacterized protein n=1 Tax=Eumeta variegata TaxID=151549 RepID=A0A4C1SBC1_EUMVA|nr:hypothetical protein EVAR_41_1 [Eumeta japonica]